jgi:hypothetical protein
MESLKPQDLVLAVWLAVGNQNAVATLAATGAALHLSASQVHAAAGRGRAARLLTTVDATKRGTSVEVHRANLLEFLIYGVKYVYPAERMGDTRGIPTSSSAEIFRSEFLKPEPGLVWPHHLGKTRGEGILPLHRSIPEIASDRPGGSPFHDVFALVDALRIGNARERGFAVKRLPALISSQR